MASREGYVYVLVNRALPGLVKIGMTGRTPEARARELSGTALPHPFKVAHSVAVDDRIAVERALHRRLRRYRVRQGREFFRLSPERARRIVDSEALRFRRRAAAGRWLLLLAAAAAGIGGLLVFRTAHALGLTPGAAAAVAAGCVLLVVCGAGKPRRRRRRR